jgi:hypothetical protein
MEGKRLKGLSADRDKAAIRHTPLAKSIRGVIAVGKSWLRSLALASSAGGPADLNRTTPVGSFPARFRRPRVKHPTGFIYQNPILGVLLLLPPA